MIQLQVINAILSRKDSSILTLNNLDGGYFSDYIDEYNFINNHLRAYGNVPDLETFLIRFPKFNVVKVEESSQYLITELFKDRNSRILANTFNKVRDLLLRDKIDDAIKLYNETQENLTSGVGLQCVDILKDTSRYEAYIDRTRSFEKFYISTGLKELDALIGGWDREEELATLVARTGSGKTWIALKFALAAAQQGLNVGIYSGEMSQNKVGYRIDTLLGHLSNGGLMHGNENIANDYKAYIDELPNKLKGSMKVLTPYMINGPAGVNALRAFIQKENLDILFVDQHSLLEDDRGAKNPIERASNISKDLKNLQVMQHIPIVAVSQQNRNSTENGFDTSMIAQSDRIAQDSTCILFIERDKDIMKIHLVKSRDCENGKCLTYQVNINEGIFTYVPSEEDGISSQDTIEELSHRYDVEGEDVF